MELQVIQNKIHEIRGLRVMLDRDLAELYQVETRTLNQAVRRNISRFPDDFMFQLTQAEFDNLMSQFATSNLISQIVISSWGGIRKLPYAFTEQGLSMLSGLLKSEIAINVNISIMRAFVATRQYLAANATVSAEIAEIRTKLQLLERNDEDNLEAINDLSQDLREDIDTIYQAIAELSIKPPPPPRRPMGYKMNIDPK